ncbi:MAG: DUF262 domain-containing protein [Chloroflexi bacterium]|nr:DUF262 domain-containing protein [Chloroflexota bacterium]
MHAVEYKLLDFLKKSTQFTIPIFQRTYSWGEEQIKQLWDDIIRTGENDNINSHFIGSVVYILHEKADAVFQSSMVIDGQQRLTTLSILLEALARHVENLVKHGGKDEPCEGFSAEKIREYYLINRLEKDDKRYKLLLTQTDKDSLINLINGDDHPIISSRRIDAAYQFFKKRLENLGSNLTALCSGLAKLMIVSISLSKDDNPQLIFESMNSTGKELSQADLIRNYVLMDLPPEKQKDLYNKYWRPMEVGFGQEAYEQHFDAFMRHYLTVRTGKIPRIRDVYKSFKDFSTNPENPFHDLESCLADIRKFSEFFRAMALGKEMDKDLGQAFQDLREINVDTAYPFMLELYEDYRNNLLSKTDFLEILRLIESYIFRRYVCGIPTNSLNKTFSTFTKTINKENYLENVAASFVLMPSYRRFPSDEEFVREIKRRDLYNFRGRSYWLRKLENHGKKEYIMVGNYTIEHIMPQNQNLSTEWQKELGPNWKKVHESMLHTLGNLTLTGYNSEYSDRSFTEKKTMTGGFAFSPITLNKGLGETETWNLQSIERRANRLAELAKAVWIFPNVSEEILSSYKEKPKLPSEYSIHNFEYLQEGNYSKTLFDAIRKEILAIDNVVYEEPLKLYIAYKAETNFVDIVPLANSLLLMINMPYENINDPEKLTRNVAEISHWGNGEVEFHLSSLDQIPYAMGLINQSFEHQMGNGREAE